MSNKYKFVFVILPTITSIFFTVRILKQALLNIVPTGDDPAFHALAIVTVAQNPLCLFVHIMPVSCNQPLVVSSLQYPNLIHFLASVLYNYSHDILLTIKLLYTVIGLLMVWVPTILYINLLNMIPSKKLAFLSGIWYAIVPFYVLNNALYTFSEGSILELLGVLIIFPLIFILIFKTSRLSLIGLMVGLTANSIPSLFLTLVFLLPYFLLLLYRKQLLVIVKIIILFLLISNILFIRYLVIFLLPDYKTAITGYASFSFPSILDYFQVGYPYKDVEIPLALLLLLSMIPLLKYKRGSLFLFAYSLIVLVEIFIWNRALRYLLLFLYFIPYFYIEIYYNIEKYPRSVIKIYFILLLGLFVFFAYNYQFYFRLLNFSGDLQRLTSAQYEIYKSLIHFFSENHVSSVATICQFSSWLLPLLESHNITALCLLAPSFIAQTPKVVPMFNIIMSVNETLSTGSFISLSKYADVLVFEPPYQGQIYNSNQLLLYNGFLRLLNLEKWKDNIIIISFKEINITSEYLSKYKIILLHVK
jgi:hypothetical protein